MAVDSNAGTKIFIGSVADETIVSQADFEGLSYVEIGEIDSAGGFGDTASTQNFTALSDRRVRKIKTTFDAGTMDITCGYDPSDAGQNALRAALLKDDNYAIKIEFDDGTSSGTTFYYRGLVTSANIDSGNAENVIRQTFQVQLNSAVVQVAAA